MRKKGKTEYIVIGLIAVLFAVVSILSFTSISRMQGNARVVNYVGIVRGATQKLVKRELAGQPDDALIARLDQIVDNLITGEGEHDLIRLESEEYLGKMAEVQRQWAVLQEHIALQRAGQPNDLFALSESYFELADATVSAAEEFSEQQVNSSILSLLVIDIVFACILLLGLGYVIRTTAIKKKAEALGRIAYIDPLTQMPNRASCEQLADRYAKAPPEGDLAVFMFDMNDLKTVNDHLGHQGGDRIIADFARILKTEAAGLGFVARYGGDEFIGIFENASDEVATQYLSAVDEKLKSYNQLHVNALEQISYAPGFVIGNLKTSTLQELVNEADKRMYIRKRQMKKDR